MIIFFLRLFNVIIHIQRVYFSTSCHRILLLLLLLYHRSSFIRSNILTIVKIGKHSKHKQILNNTDHHGRLRIITGAAEQALRKVQCKYDKLNLRWEKKIKKKIKNTYIEKYHLSLGQQFLPPSQRLYVHQIPCRQQVIEIHQNVNDRIQNAQQRRMATGQKANCHKGYAHHYGVMVNVQKRNVLLFLAQHKEERVQHVNDFGQEVKVRGHCNRSTPLCVFVAHTFTAPIEISLSKGPVNSLKSENGT